MITRRGLHKTALALALAGLAAPIAGRASTPDARHALLLNRLSYGRSQDAAATLDRMGLAAWLDAELAKPDMDVDLADRLSRARLKIEYEADRTAEGASWAALSELRPFQHLGTDPKDRLPLLDYGQGYAYQERLRPAYEVIAASLIRAVHSKAQLRELVTQFWHEHFSVNATTDEATSVFFPEHDAAIRTHALGNFRAMLGAVARSPSMLIYLNNDVSRASPANENYGRELLELHTLGARHYLNDLYDDWKAVPGAEAGRAEGYIDQDVYEVARAFTGWTVGDGKWLGDGQHAPKSGRFEYVEAWHDPYQKRVLGVEFGPNRAKMADGETVLDLLAAHPGTARFVTGKLMRRLGIETPSDGYRARIADVFVAETDAPDQIAHVIRAIVRDPEFLATPAQKLRTPFEFLAGLYRATGAEITATDLGFSWWLGRAGWTQHEVRPPTGHSDASADWANTRCLNGLVDLALFAHAEWFETATLDLSSTYGASHWGDLAAHWADAFGADPAIMEQSLTHLEADPASPVTDSPDHLNWANRSLISLAALQSGFLFR